VPASDPLSLRRHAGKLAAVTGGGRGIGQHVARAFARESARVVILRPGAWELDDLFARFRDAFGTDLGST
jgi:NAD(P)-dependent dehydrogenase (short-subunit alcohol dehydrogenase family)